MWVRRKKGIRIFQSSHGFLKKTEKQKSTKARPKKTKNQQVTIGERIDNFGKTALVIDDRFSDIPLRYSQLQLNEHFKILLDRLVYSIAQDGRYLGDGKIQILGKEDFYPWIKTQNP